MSIKRYSATQDATIVNAYEPNLLTRGTGSNTGQADIMEIFSIYGQAASSSVELARSLIQFDIDTMISDRNAGSIPVSGSVTFYLNIYNARHGFTLPEQFNINVLPVTKSWEEGHGLDMDNYTDLTYDGYGTNWDNAASGSAWENEGGDFVTDYSTNQYFERGDENIEVDITDITERWIAGTQANYGVALKLSGSHEQAVRSYYTKRFFARGSEYFFKRPTIEARWDSTLKDNRGNFYVSSSNASATENLNSLYLYNFVRGQLRDLPNVGTGSVYTSFHTSASGGEELTVVTPTYPVTATWVASGTYLATFALETTASTVFDRWYSGSVYYYTGSFETNSQLSNLIVDNTPYIVTIENLKPIYAKEEKPRFRVFTRKKDWKPNIYVSTTNNIEADIIEDLYFKVTREIDGLDIVNWGTSSATEHTRTSYDLSGSYFDFDMNILQEDYSYRFYLGYKNFANKFQELPESFKFRVE